MSWWGNSLDKAVGFSSYASTALKNAQKKIDKVLDIPTVDFEQGETDKSEQNVKTDAAFNDSLSKFNDSSIDQIPSTDPISFSLKKADCQNFTDVDLTSPPKNLKFIHNLDSTLPDNNTERLGDWNIDESLTVSQFDQYSKVLSINKPSEQLSDDKQDIMLDTSNNISEKSEELHSARISHLSLSSDVTVKKSGDKNDQMDSSGNLDDVDNDSDNNKIVMEKQENDEIRICNETEETSEDIQDSDGLKLDSPSAKDEQDSQTTTTSSDIELIPNLNISASYSQPPDHFNLSVHIPQTSLSPQNDNLPSASHSFPAQLSSSSVEASSKSTQPANTHNQSTSRAHTRQYSRSVSGGSSSMSICRVEDEYISPMNIYGNNHTALLINPSNSNSTGNSNELADLYYYQQQCNDFQKKMEIKESKMIQISRENIDLRETIHNLTRQIEQMNENDHSETDSTDITALTREFTTRLNEAEKRVIVAVKEKDQYKKIVNDLKNAESQKIENVIKEKEQQVADLLMEGEKLAQEMLKVNNAAKKMRINVKEKETEINTLVSQLAKSDAEIVHLKKVIENRNDNEQKHVEGINQLTNAVEKLEKENRQLKNSNENFHENHSSLDNSLKKSTQEIISLKHQVVELQSTNKQLSAEVNKLRNLQSNKSEKLADFEMKLELKHEEVVSFQKKLLSQTRDWTTREEEYTSRITYLQERLAETQQRLDETNEVVSMATKPLMRQLDMLRNACSSHTASWEMMEQNLNGRIRDLQQKLILSEESTSTYKEELQNQEIVVSSIREEKNQMLKKIRQEDKKKQKLLDEKVELEIVISELRKTHEIEIEKLDKQITDLRKELSELKVALEMEKQNTLNLNVRLSNAQMTVTQRDISTRRKLESNSSVVTDVDPDDSVSLQGHRSDRDGLNHGQAGTIKGTDNMSSLYDNIRSQGVAVIQESLQASLKQKDGQIHKLQLDVANLTESRENLISELSELQQSIEELQQQLDECKDNNSRYTELSERYDALLQMYGEKMDECEELKMDLAEVKDVYRSHIDMLSKSSKE